MHLNRASTLLSLIPSVLGAYNVKPFKIDLSSKVPHMKDPIQRTKLPAYSVLGDAGAGIPLDWLKARQKGWLNSFDWNQEQAAMKKFNHSTVDIGNITVHFIHQRSSDPKAIPLLLTHGWPGSFYEFHNVIKPLSNTGKDSNISFHIVVPSLPGHGFSSPAPIGIRHIHSLRRRLGCWSHLGPSKQPWRYYSSGLVQRDAATIRPLNRRLDSNSVFATSGNGYLVEQSTRPATIGLALYDNPVGQLAWIGEKFLEWSDPQFGVPPSTITNNTILTEVSLYYLTGTFETSVNTYFRNPAGWSPTMLHAVNNVPMGYAAYYYDLDYYPEFYVSKIGNLVYYAGKPVSLVIHPILTDD
ncbi:epoxide hydrolase [Ceratobasidium sp. AG-Ba]|nr:epoxide hydrolase [Ceratobasidium sp. AG-Ba]